MARPTVGRAMTCVIESPITYWLQQVHRAALANFGLRSIPSPGLRQVLCNRAGSLTFSPESNGCCIAGILVTMVRYSCRGSNGDGGRCHGIPSILLRSWYCLPADRSSVSCQNVLCLGSGSSGKRTAEEPPVILSPKHTWPTCEHIWARQAAQNPS